MKSLNVFRIVVLCASFSLTSAQSLLPVFSTGVSTNYASLSGGDVDPHWQLIQSPAGGGYSSAAYSISDPNWASPDGNFAGTWIGATNVSEAKPGKYVFRQTFDLTGFTLTSLEGYIAADNNYRVKLNGTTILSDFNADCYSVITPFKITNGFNAAANTLDIEVTNLLTFDNPSGLLFQLTNLNLARNGKDIYWQKNNEPIRLWGLRTDATYKQSLLPASTESDSAWRVRTACDLNGDGVLDLVWRNSSTGSNRVWYVNLDGSHTSTALPDRADVNWDIRASGDFNADGHVDLVWRNYSNGTNDVWFMNGASNTGSATLITVSTTSGWDLEGAADFNGDGDPDLVWRNPSLTYNHVWEMSGTTYVQSVALLNVSGAWDIDAFLDLDDDGSADIVWRHGTLGYVHVWLMDGYDYLSSVEFPSETDLNWKIVGPR
jgi:hypothetical protein